MRVLLHNSVIKQICYNFSKWERGRVAYYFKGKLPDYINPDNKLIKVGEFEIDVKPTGIRRITRHLPILKRIPYSTMRSPTILISIRHRVLEEEGDTPYFVYISQIIPDYKYPDFMNVSPEVKPEKRIFTTIQGISKKECCIPLLLPVLTEAETHKYLIRINTGLQIGEPELLCSLEVNPEWYILKPIVAVLITIVGGLVGGLIGYILKTIFG